MSDAPVKRVLNVGGNSKAIPLPPQFAGFEHHMLDIDPETKPDILCDARTLKTLTVEPYDAVYCAHNLEHYHRHEVRDVLAGFLHVLKPGGFAYIAVPDLMELMAVTVANRLDIDDVLYNSTAGPIRVVDVLYGYSEEIEHRGLDFFAHKTGFSQKSLSSALKRAGFSAIFNKAANLEVTAIAFKDTPDPASFALFGLSTPVAEQPARA